MRNIDGLTHKQFLFCEELLRNGFNVDAAYRVAYPNDKGRNGPRTLKAKECIKYLNKRQQEQQVTMDVLLAKAHKRLASIIDTGGDKDAAKAIEIVKETESRLKELKVKEKELEQMPDKREQKQINITISEAKKPD